MAPLASGARAVVASPGPVRLVRGLPALRALVVGEFEAMQGITWVMGLTFVFVYLISLEEGQEARGHRARQDQEVEASAQHWGLAGGLGSVSMLPLSFS